MPERGLESIAQSVSGLDLREFFERYVRGKGDLPLQKLLKDFGIVMRLRPQDGIDDYGGKPSSAEREPPPWVGMGVSAKSGRDVVTVVHSDGPAEHAGIAPGDELVSLNDVRVTAENMDTRLREYHAGDRVTFRVFRYDGLLSFKVRLAEPPEDTCWLQFDETRTEEVEQRQSTWLRQ
jgi:predicted metalloprotease with PDZ domain